MDKALTEKDLDALPWGSVVCETDTNGHRTLHVKTGQEGYEYWAAPEEEGSTYPCSYGGTVTLWHRPTDAIVPPGGQPTMNPGQLLLRLPMGVTELGAVAEALSRSFPGTTLQGDGEYLIVTLGPMRGRRT